jgi:hypothetical protein
VITIGDIGKTVVPRRIYGRPPDEEAPLEPAPELVPEPEQVPVPA